MLFRSGSFCGDLGDILGLEKFLFSNSYYGRRRLLMSSVLEEQAWQRISKEMRRRRGISGDVDVDGHNSLIRLASIAEKNSRWAKERASVAALALESDLLEESGEGSSRSSKDHGWWRQDNHNQPARDQSLSRRFHFHLQ